MQMTQYTIAAHWMDRDDKTYYYGPFVGQEELALGMLYLSALWAEKIAAGQMGLYPFHLARPAWLKEPTLTLETGFPPAPWLGKHQEVVGYPMDCKDRPVSGDPTCVQVAGHAGPHQTQEQWDSID